MKKLNESDFYNRVSYTVPSVELLEDYANSRTKIKVRCKKCGREWETFPQNLLKGHGCKHCGQNTALQTRRSHPTERTIGLAKELSAKYPNIVIPNDLRITTETFTAHCNICGNDWETSLTRLSHINGCSKCSRNSTSLAEQFIYETLCRTLPDVEVINGNRKFIGKELDILIPELNKAIEYGAWYWHKNKINRDIEKERECAAKGIELLTIYEHVQETPDVLPNNTIVLEKQASRLQSIIDITKQVLEFVDPNIDTNRTDWESIYEVALSRLDRDAKIAHFKKRFEEEIQGIEILGEYSRYHDPIKVRCKKCGHEWMSRPKYLFDNVGCPNCARIAQAENQLKSTDEFAAELVKLNPNLELVGEYEYSKNMVKVRCKNCGTVWEARADYVLRDHKCPMCEAAMHRRGVKVASPMGHIKKKEKLEEKLAVRDKNIEVIGAVISDTDLVECRCKKCGTVFMRSPKDLRRHPHCPKCNKHFRYTPNTFREKIAEVNPDIEVIGDFKKQAEKLECKCKTCGHHWEVTPNKLLQGRGCPKCAAKKRSAAGVAARKAKKEKEIQ